MALGHDAGIRRPHQRVLELLFGRFDRRTCGLYARFRGIARGDGLVVLALGTRAGIEQRLRARELLGGLVLSGERLGERGLGLAQGGFLFAVGEAHDRFAGFDVVVHVVVHLGDAAGRLCRHRSLVHGLDSAVVDSLERRLRDFDDGRIERQLRRGNLGPGDGDEDKRSKMRMFAVAMDHVGSLGAGMQYSECSVSRIERASSPVKE